VEGASSHGTALNRHLARNDVRVIEINRPDRAARRRRGKTDALDAENAARVVLSRQATAVAKRGDGAVEMIRLFKVAKDSATKARTQAINQLRAVLARATRVSGRTRPGHSPASLHRPVPSVDSDAGVGDMIHILTQRVSLHQTRGCSASAGAHLTGPGQARWVEGGSGSQMGGLNVPQTR
jgi:transposase